MRDIDFDAPVPNGYWRNGRGDLVHESNISATDRDMDETVSKIHDFGTDLSAQMWRFRVYTMDDIAAFMGRVLERSGAKGRGTKGNLTLTSFDGRRQVKISIAEYVSIGPEIVAAQALMDECLERWTRGSAREIKALIEGAFTPNHEGQLSVSALLRLRRIEIDDPQWRAMQHAIADAMRPSSTTEYVRLYWRATPRERFQQVSLHLATVSPPPAETDEKTPAAQLQRRARSAVLEARRAGMSETAIRETLLAAKRREPLIVVPSAPAGERSADAEPDPA